MSRKYPSIQIRSRGNEDDDNHDNDVESDTAAASTAAHHEPHLNIPATSVTQLILAHLTEHGLHESVKAVQQESRVGMAASFVPNWHHLATSGQWDAILSAISVLDDAALLINPTLRLRVYEHIILELADDGEWETSYALYRMFQQQQQQLQQQRQSDEYVPGGDAIRMKKRPMKVSIDAKLADLAARRAKDPQCPVREDYYYYGNNDDSSISPSNNKQACRQWIGQQLQQTIPKQPPDRLVSLLQQSVKWQSYTGQLLPTIDGKIFDLVLGQVEGGSTVVVPVGERYNNSNNQKKKKLVKKEGVTIKFGKRAVCEAAVFLPDGSGLVTGSSDGLVEIWDVHTGQPVPRPPAAVGDNGGEGKEEEEVIMTHDTAVTAVAVSNDTTLLATGGSDGTVNVWRTESGKLLRQLDTKTYVCYLAFHPTGDRILVAGQDGSCREYGLRGAKMLQEFSAGDTGTTSFLTQCLYAPWPLSTLTVPTNATTKKQKRHHEPDVLYGRDEFLSVMTAHGDGTVRLWDAVTASVVLVLQPVSGNNSSDKSRLPGVGSSLIASDQQSVAIGAAIVGVYCLHTPLHSVLIVPRHVRAYLCDARGTVLRCFDVPVDSSKTIVTAPGTTATAMARTKTSPPPAVFVAATVSSCNRWLYAVTEDGACHIFDVTTGELERSLLHFGACSTTSSSSSSSSAKGVDDATDHGTTTTAATASTTIAAKAPPELSSIIYHPHSDLIAAFSNDKNQRKGKLVVWRYR
jgi:WD40 repeat-containing protein SMU1